MAALDLAHEPFQCAAALRLGQTHHQFGHGVELHRLTQFAGTQTGSNGQMRLAGANRPVQYEISSTLNKCTFG
ncbi:hypothetical protein J2Z45_000770 [Cohnella lubricantis]|nr:hypothetical protein [Cohnella lubricantis]